MGSICTGNSNTIISGRPTIPIWRAAFTSITNSDPKKKKLKI